MAEITHEQEEGSWKSVASTLRSSGNDEDPIEKMWMRHRFVRSVLLDQSGSFLVIVAGEPKAVSVSLS